MLLIFQFNPLRLFSGTSVVLSVQSILETISDKQVKSELFGVRLEPENTHVWAKNCTLDLGLGAKGFRTGALLCFDDPLKAAGFLDIVMLSKTLVVLG